jgi:Tfp pilus assembly protein PilV
MSARPGVSLVEVLVCVLLLALGIGGTVQALVASARLQRDADRREVVVGLLLDRLAWFETVACAGGDTAGLTRATEGPQAQWRVEAVGSRRVLTLEGSRVSGPAAPRTQVVTTRACP